MTTPYTVALVVDPDFGSRLVAVSSRVHTWIVATAPNAAAAEKIWTAQAGPYSIERGVMIFHADLDKDRNSWCEIMLDAVDEHHNSYWRQSSPIFEPGWARHWACCHVCAEGIPHGSLIALSTTRQSFVQ